MARKFLVPLDLTQLELLNAALQKLASAPSTPVLGQVYFDTTLGIPRVWDGSDWLDLTEFPGYDVVVTETGFGQASANGSAATVSRSDHTHGTPTHDGAAHAAVSLSSLAAPTADLPMGGFKLTGVGTPTADGDAATKAYADGVASGLDFKESVRAASTANIDLATGGLAVQDGVTPVAGDRILVKNQTTASENGIYVAAAGTWTRTADADTDDEVNPGLFVFVEEGTTQADTGWVLSTNNPITLGTTALVFTQFGSATSITAGGGLTKTGDTLDVGAGTGIVVNADDVAIDTTVVGRKFAATIGDGAATEFTVTHNLGTRDVIARVYRDSTPWDEVDVDVERPTVNTVLLRFAVAPVTDSFRVVGTA